MINLNDAQKKFLLKTWFENDFGVNNLEKYFDTYDKKFICSLPIAVELANNGWHKIIWDGRFITTINCVTYEDEFNALMALGDK